MRKKIVLFFFLRIAGCCLFTVWHNMTVAQTVVGSRTFTSQVDGVDGAKADDMVQLNRSVLYSPLRHPFGIMGTINAPGGKITVSIYVSDNSLNITRMIFEATINSSSPNQYSVNSFQMITHPDYQFGMIRSDDPNILAMIQFATSYPGSGIISLAGKIPVIVEVTVTDATFIQALLPGIGVYTLDFPWGHPCFANPSAPCNTLREFRMGDVDQVVVIPHRGVWGDDDTPEGGMKALQQASEEEYSFTELDIRLSKDRWPLLLHDQEVNRMTDMPATPDQCDAASIKNLNAYSTTIGVPKRNPNNPLDQQYDINSPYQPLSFGHLRDRFGDENLNDPIENLGPALDYIANRNIFLILDIQEKNMADYLVATLQCLKLAKNKGLLHKLIFKHGSVRLLSRETLEDYLSGTNPDYPGNAWSDYAYKTSTIVTIHPTNLNDPDGDPEITNMDPGSPLYGSIQWDYLKARINDWMALPSVIGFEVVFKCEYNDPMLTAASISTSHTTAFQGRSVVRYIKDMSYRTGNQWEIPTDCRGIPNGRGSWYDKTGKLTFPYAAYSQDCYDLRGNPEWVVNPPGYVEDIDPGFIITDRPLILEQICAELGRFNPATFMH